MRELRNVREMPGGKAPKVFLGLFKGPKIGDTFDQSSRQEPREACMPFRYGSDRVRELHYFKDGRSRA